MTPRAAVLWSIGGVLCTPAWFYGTSTFDDILCALALVSAVVYALRVGGTKGRWAAFVSGSCWDRLQRERAARRVRARRAGRRGPSDSGPQRTLGSRLLIRPGPGRGNRDGRSLRPLQVPPGCQGATRSVAGAISDAFSSRPLVGARRVDREPIRGFPTRDRPPMLLAIVGLQRWYRHSRRFLWTVAASSAVFVCFIASLSFAKGDPAWGPKVSDAVVCLAVVICCRQHVAASAY